MQITSCLRVVLLESEILKCLYILKSSQQKVQTSNSKFAFVCSLPLWVSSSALVSITSSSIVTISCDWEIWLSRLQNWGGDSVWTVWGEDATDPFPPRPDPATMLQSDCDTEGQRYLLPSRCLASHSSPWPLDEACLVSFSSRCAVGPLRNCSTPPRCPTSIYLQRKNTIEHIVSKTVHFSGNKCIHSHCFLRPSLLATDYR